ncbi:MAG TPA: hypothetical protein VFT74_18905 [Isosphaeraceae bacterium]|nr:hypothetical protein [Isosphaeraceae bacterium]
MPPRELPKNARSITIRDVDRGVKLWFDRVLDVWVTHPDQVRRKVAVKLSSGERFVAAADQQGLRDRDGRLILPVIHITRTGIDPLNNMTALGINVPKLQVARLVSEKASELANLDQSRPISERRLRDSAVYEVWTVPYPSNNNLTYRVKVQASYQSHLNEIVEKLLNRLEFFDVPTFVISLADDVRDHANRTGEGSTEVEPAADSPYENRRPLDDYYVVGYIEGSIQDEGNLEEFTDQERILQLQFTFRVPAALMLDPSGERPAVQVEQTAFGISFSGDERITVVDDPAVADKIFGRKK